MMLPFITKAAIATQSLAPVKIAATLNHFRGGDMGAAVQAFDMGLAKTRLEGLAYGTVTALIIGSSLGLFKCVPNGKKTLLPLPEGDSKARRSAQLENCIRLLYFISTSISVALGTYTTIIFTLMSIYSKTALGMGLQEKYLEFFNACAKFRVHGFHAFMGSLMSFSFGWTLALFLCVEGDMKWWVAAPAALFTIVGYMHYREIFHLATTLIFS